MATFFTFFAIAPLLKPGYFWAAHDARHDVYFIMQYNITWDEGTLFPRWSPDWAFGYGYPFFNIYAPGATFIGALLYRVLSLSLEAAVEATLIVTILVGAWGMWFFVRDWLGEKAALVAAVAFVYAPYHLLDIYVRAAMAESLALAVLPWVLWAARRAAFAPGPLSIVALALTYAALHLSSNLVALIFTPLLGAYLVALALKRVASHTDLKGRVWGWLRALFAPGLGLLLGAALASFFILPALTEARFVNLDQWFGGYYNFRDHFVYFAQLFDPRWGFGISQPGPDDPLSYQLGLVLFGLAVLAFWGWLRRDSRHRLEIGFWLLALVVSVWLTTAAAVWAWERVPFVSSAQFPWRYLTLAVVALAALAPAVLVQHPVRKENGRDWIAALTLSGLLVLGGAPYLRVETTPPPPGGATLAGLMEFQRSSDEMTGMTMTAQAIARWSPLADLYVAGLPVENRVDYSRVPQNETLAVDAREHRVDRELVRVYAKEPGQRVPFYRQWYPGWTATIMDPETGEVIERFPLTPEDTYPPYGLLNVPIPAGDHLLLISFEDTPVRRVGESISWLALALIVLLLLWSVLGRRFKAVPRI
ncbi:MAG: hypothetical protein GXP42_04220 [Chloroflexi bacterium]|nr:hypothetical protein [Chloroflexota bacterium]